MTPTGTQNPSQPISDANRVTTELTDDQIGQIAESIETRHWATKVLEAGYASVEEAGLYECISDRATAYDQKTPLSRPLSPLRPPVTMNFGFGGLPVAVGAVVEIAPGDKINRPHFAANFRKLSAEEASLAVSIQDLARRAPIAKHSDDAARIVADRKRAVARFEEELLAKQIELQEAEKMLAHFSRNAATAKDQLAAWYELRGDPSEVEARFNIAANLKVGAPKPKPSPFADGARMAAGGAVPLERVSRGSESDYMRELAYRSQRS